MVRHAYVQQKVLELYCMMNQITYPITPEDLLVDLPIESKMMSYSTMAKISGCTTQDVAIMCASESGATHYSASQNRCLILYNDNMNEGRILWTKCHEVGHITIGHMGLLECNVAANSDGRIANDFEHEADYFTWNMMAPLPIMREMGIQNVKQTIETFGFSVQAANLQFDRFQKWKRSHIKTAWENQMLREFRLKYKG